MECNTKTIHSISFDVPPSSKNKTDNSSNKIILLPISEPPNSNKKEIKEKERTKRQVTSTSKWTFSQIELCENQSTLLSEPSKQPFIYQQIKNKLSSYRSQDIEKKLLDDENLADLSGVLQKMKDCRLTCFYCKEPVQVLYENVREPKQWTLERIDNKQGHIITNVEIACLSCNLRRRTMKYERYVLTKNIQKIVKTGTTS